jgi:UDPglucose 6-dehydrogenase
MICVLGLGFVGLTTATGFSEKGFKVYGYEIDEKKLKNLQNGEIPFYEKGLADAFNKNLNKNLILTNSLEKVLKNSKIIFLCVGTPSDDEGVADLKYIYFALDSILKIVSKDDKKVIIIKSTIPPSTTERVITPFIENRKFKVDKDIYLINNPEFLREGHAWNDFINPDRIVVGTNSEYPKKILNEIYEKFNVPIHFVSLNTGEFIKYLSNTFLSTLISFSNEMSMIADNIGGINIKDAFNIFHEDKRWFGNPAPMTTYVFPGCGFGGYCLPKDTQALISKASEFNHNAKILKNVINVNNKIKNHWIEKITKNLDKDELISILGLSFKPNSDDIRDSPARNIINLLLDNGYKNIIAYDPMANEIFEKTYKLDIKYVSSMEKAVKKSNNVLIVTAWDEFKEKEKFLENKTIFDLRYLL